MGVLTGKTVAILVANEFEDLEVYYPLLRLSEEGAKVILGLVTLGAAPRPYLTGKPITGRHGLTAPPPFLGEGYRYVTKPMAQLCLDEIDAVVIPGGFAPDVLRRDPAAVEFVRAAVAANPVVAEVVGVDRNYSAVDAFNALYRVRELEAQTRHVWDEFDVLMVPTAPNLPTFADVAAAPVARNSELGTYTNLVNLLRLSAVAVPFGFTPDGLPFGVTFIARGGCDWALAKFAASWQQSMALPLGAKLRPLQEADTRITATPPGAIPLAVVGAHLAGMPLHHQLTERGARLRACTTIAPKYRLYALKGTQPPKPGLARAVQGAAIAVEVYDMPAETVGSFLAGIPAPLGLGEIELADGSRVNGFICEPCALADAEDITAWGGWSNYLESQSKKRA